MSASDRQTRALNCDPDQATPSPVDEVDPFLVSPTEEDGAPAATGRRRRRFVFVASILGAVVLLASVTLAVTGIPRSIGGLFRPKDATLVVQTTSAGWQVLEGGRQLGTTPLTVALAPGSHKLVLQRGTTTRSLDVSLAAGAQVVHHLDLPEPPAVGALHVGSAPPGAAVAVDGVQRGKTPVDLTDLPPGEHAVTLTIGDRVVNEFVTITAGVASSLVVPLAPAAGAGVGWATIAAPIELQVYEGDSLVGSSRNPRIMLMPGRHDLRLVNPAVAFETTSTVAIVQGAVAKVAVKVPNGVISVNAVPWAEVLLDGKVIGETPIANLAVPLGSHELVLRNPKFAEQRRTVVVSLAAPLRIGVDLRQ